MKVKSMKKIRITRLQRFNAEFVRDSMWPAVPPDRVVHELNVFRARLNNGDPSDYTIVSARHKVDCKTVACFGGWLALNPYFQSLGVTPDTVGAPYMSDRACRWSSRNSIEAVSKKLFGAFDLFAMRRPKERGTDHEVVMKRIKRLIRTSFVTSGKRPTA